METGVGGMFDHVAGGGANVTSSWPSEYRMLLDVKAMGQSASAVVDVEDQIVRVALTLPLLLSFMASTIADSVRRSGETLLLSDDGGTR